LAEWAACWIEGEILRCASFLRQGRQNDVKTWATVVPEKKAALEEPPFFLAGDAAGGQKMNFPVTWAIL
jgi:hypothetical protein